MMKLTYILAIDGIHAATVIIKQAANKPQSAQCVLVTPSGSIIDIRSADASLPRGAQAIANEAFADCWQWQELHGAEWCEPLVSVVG